MIARRHKRRVLQHLGEIPAVALLGPRQVGKTTLARVIAAETPDCLYLDLENPEDAGPPNGPGTIPSSPCRSPGDSGRGPADARALPGCFAVRLTSAADEAAARGIFYSSGRLPTRCSANRRSRSPAASSTRSCPGSTPWRSMPSTTRSGYAGGFPRLLHPPGATRRAPAGGSTSSAPTWSATSRNSACGCRPRPCGASGRCSATAREGSSTLPSWRGASTSSVPAVKRYVDLLSDLMLVRRLPPWFANVGKRLVKDSQVVHPRQRHPALLFSASEASTTCSPIRWSGQAGKDS